MTKSITAIALASVMAVLSGAACTERPADKSVANSVPQRVQTLVFLKKVTFLTVPGDRSEVCANLPIIGRRCEQHDGSRLGIESYVSKNHEVGQIVVDQHIRLYEEVVAVTQRALQPTDRFDPRLELRIVVIRVYQTADHPATRVKGDAIARDLEVIQQWRHELEDRAIIACS